MAAKILWESWESNSDALYDAGATYRMLMGMSFELLFKSFCIAKGREFTLTHDLNLLAKEAGFELDEKEKNIFAILSGYIYWEGRYPVPRSIGTRKKTISGAEGIKLQWEPFVPHYSCEQKILEEEPENSSKLTRRDLDYGNLLLVWKKFNKDYVNQCIT